MRDIPPAARRLRERIKEQDARRAAIKRAEAFVRAQLSLKQEQEAVRRRLQEVLASARPRRRSLLQRIFG